MEDVKFKALYEEIVKLSIGEKIAELRHKHNMTQREHGYTKAESGRIVRHRNFGTFQAKKSHGQVRAKFDDSKNFFKNLYWKKLKKSLTV